MGLEGLLVVALTFTVLILLVMEKATVDAIGIGLLVVLVGAGAVLQALDPGFTPGERLLGVGCYGWFAKPILGFAASKGWDSVT